MIATQNTIAMTTAIAFSGKSCGTMRRAVSPRRRPAGRGEDLAAADDHGAVVQRRARHEDRGEELRGEFSVHRYAGFAVILESGAPLDDDERAVPGLGDEQRRAHELVDDVIDLLLRLLDQQAVQRTELTQLSERATQLRLEHDQQREHGEREDGGE